jgi:adenylate cyclase
MSSEAPESRDKQPGAVPPPASGSTPPSHSVHIKFKFLEQLKRRNVVRVAILYVVVCYLILEPFGLLVHVLALPEWIGRTVVVLMAVGFPAVLLFAWVYEITPEGLKQTVEVDPQRSIRKLTGQRLNRAIVAVMAVALAYFVVDKFWLSKHATTQQPAAQVASVAPATAPAATAISDKSVAVLPFLDMSEKKDQEYFSDGLSEEVLDLLARIPELHVVARTSAFSFKGKSDDIPTIARKLLVTNVLEGSVRRSGNHLRITAQLVRADNGYHLWSQTYDRKLDDIFKIQDDIAGSVVQALKVALLEGSPPKATETQSTEAYTLYVQAKSMISRANTQGEYEKVADYLQRVLKLDPKFAPAWALLSKVHSYRAEESTSGPLAQDIEEARRAARQALALDPLLPEAHQAMKIILSAFDWDWTGAQAEAQRALALDPGNSDVVLSAGVLAFVLGQYDKALTFFQRAAATDPLNSDAQLWLSWSFWRAGKYSEALGAVRKVLDLNPGQTYGHFIVASMLLKAGDSAGALTEIDLGSDYERSLSRAYVFHALGRKADADLAITVFERKYAEGDAYHIAGLHAFRGESDLAFAWLDRAYRQRDTALEYVKCDLLFENLQADPRYKAFLRKMKLPE